MLTGEPFARCLAIGALLERRLFAEKYLAYYLGSSALDKGLGSDLIDEFEQREERIMRLGELARVLTDSGHLFITALPELEEDDVAILRRLNTPNEILVVSIGGHGLSGDAVVKLDDRLDRRRFGRFNMQRVEKDRDHSRLLDIGEEHTAMLDAARVEMGSRQPLLAYRQHASGASTRFRRMMHVRLLRRRNHRRERRRWLPTWKTPTYIASRNMSGGAAA